MINYHYEVDFELDSEESFSDWIVRIITTENFTSGELNFIFCDDAYLHKINVEYLDHDTYTDIITFDYREGNNISGDVFISVERIRENAEVYKTTFDAELKRVMAHGVLHIMGYKDKTDQDAVLMRNKEEEKMNMFHVKPFNG